ncbi:hypothetical protein AAC387_Pa05g1718 [Persea americana]
MEVFGSLASRLPNVDPVLPSPLSSPNCRRQYSVRAGGSGDEGKVARRKETNSWKIDFSGEKPATPLLDTINYPIHMKNLSTRDLDQLAAELRADIVYSVSKTVNKESEQHPIINHNKPEITLDYGRQLSLRASFRRSTSHGQSGVENRSRHSFSFPLGLSTGLNIQETQDSEPEIEKRSKQAHEVPLRHLAYLSKPEIPVLLLGAIAAAVNGVILPVFGVLLTGIIKTFYEPPSRLRKDSKFWSLMFIALGLVSFVASPTRKSIRISPRGFWVLGMKSLEWVFLFFPLIFLMVMNR